MAMTACSECRKEMSNQARTCPHCGAPNKASPMAGGIKLALWIIGLALVVGLGVPIISTASKPTLTPAQKDMKIHARIAIIQCKASKYCSDSELNARVNEYKQMFGENPE